MLSLTLDHQTVLKKLLQIGRTAGEAILDIYENDFTVEAKTDQSPITKADLASHHIILAALKELTPDIPILSEESSEIIAAKAWRQWDTYWLIDPPDGTKEFVKRNGEFTVNIALIHQQVAIIGAVYVPTKGITYLGSTLIGSYKLDQTEHE